MLDYANKLTSIIPFLFNGKKKILIFDNSINCNNIEILACKLIIHEDQIVYIERPNNK